MEEVLGACGRGGWGMMPERQTVIKLQNSKLKSLDFSEGIQKTLKDFEQGDLHFRKCSGNSVQDESGVQTINWNEGLLIRRLY